MDIFKFFSALDEKEIAGLVTDGRQENLHLEFKVVRSAALKSEDDKRNLARALSGFANSAGGVVIWGIDARKGEDGIDRALSVVPVDPVEQLASRLNELTGDYVEPRIDGVQHRAILLAGHAGVAATLVPASDAGPHMAKAGEDRYYKRNGDSFYRLEHFDISDMFGRRRRPKLRQVTSIHPAGSITSNGSKRYRLKVVLSLRNEGRGTARAPYLLIRLGAPYEVNQYGVDGNGWEGMKRLVTFGGGEKEVAYGSDASSVIHPGTQRDVCAIAVEVLAIGPAPDSLQISYVIGAEDAPADERETIVASETLLNSLA